MSNLRLSISALSNTGMVRKKNEDYVGYHKPQELEKLEKYGSIFVVADGVGGNAKGEVASKLAVETVIDSYYKQPLELSPDKRLKKAVEKANEVVLNKSHEVGAQGMATTVVCVAIIDNNAYVANVGDSRAYIINEKRNGGIRQITLDHSLVAEQVRRGILTEEEAKNASNKNVITRAVGMDYLIQVDLFRVKLIPGDNVLLCTDGLVRVVEDSEIFNVVSSNSEENATLQLINLANRRGGPDNITVCIVGVEEARVKALAITIPLAFAVLVAVAGIFLFQKFKTNENPQIAYLSITSNPSNVEVFIDDDKESIGKTPINDYELKPGKYKVSFKKENYIDKIITVDLDEVKDEKDALELSISDDSLANSIPSGITVSLNNSKQPIKEAHTKISLRSTIAIAATLQKRKASIYVYAKVDLKSLSGISVYLDDKCIGTTPIENYEVEVGKYTLKLAGQNYESEKKDIEVKVDSHNKFNIQMSRSQTTKVNSSLTIESYPSGADVDIDGVKIGKKTPLIKHQLSEGPHAITLRKKGYEDLKYNFEIKPGEEKTLKLSLDWLLIITSDPPGAEIWIDDFKDKSGVTGDIYKFRDFKKEGTYKVTLKKAGYKNYSTTVDIKYGVTRTIDVKLTPLPKVSVNVSIENYSNLSNELKDVLKGTMIFISGHGKGPMGDDGTATVQVQSEANHTVELKNDAFISIFATQYISPTAPSAIKVYFKAYTLTLNFKDSLPDDYEGAKIYICDTDTKQTVKKDSTVKLNLIVPSDKNGIVYLKLSKGGFSDYTRDVNLDKDKSIVIQLGFVKVTAVDSSSSTEIKADIYISSKEIKADIYIKTNKIGTTPLTLVLALDKDYTLTIKKAGYKDNSQTITKVKEGENGAIKVELEKLEKKPDERSQ